MSEVIVVPAAELEAQTPVWHHHRSTSQLKHRHKHKTFLSITEYLGDLWISAFAWMLDLYLNQLEAQTLIWHHHRLTNTGRLTQADQLQLVCTWGCIGTPCMFLYSPWSTLTVISYDYCHMLQIYVRLHKKNTKLFSVSNSLSSHKIMLKTSCGT